MTLLDVYSDTYFDTYGVGALAAPAVDEADEWQLFVRRGDMKHEGPIDDFQSLEARLRFNAVGSWLLDLDATKTGRITEEGFGFELTRNGRYVTGGPMRHSGRKLDANSDRVEVSGPDDLTWLADRLALPDPADPAPPYTGAYDVVTAHAASVMAHFVDVNCGPSAMSHRRHNFLTIETPPSTLGSTITGRARWHNLLERLASFALRGGGLGFRLIPPDPPTDPPTLTFSVYQPADRTREVVFSIDLGNLDRFDYSSDAPDVTYAIVGGAGEGAARLIRERGDSGGIVRFGRIERFYDERSADTNAELDQALTQALADAAGETAIDAGVVDTGGWRFGRDYQLGDRVTVIVDGVPITEVVREVVIKATPDRGFEVTPIVGSPGGTAPRQVIERLFRANRRLAAQVSELQRR